MGRSANGSLRWLATVASAIALAGFVGASGASGEPADSFDRLSREATGERGNHPAEQVNFATRASRLLTARAVEEVMAREAAEPAGTKPSAGSGEHTRLSAAREEEGFVEEYDPWEHFNEATFSFNRKLDRFVLKPVARTWDKVLPNPVQRSLGRALDNVGMPRRLVNNLLQLKPEGAGRELARFLLNSTVGIAGLFDAAKALGIEESNEDTGQTLATYGAGPGPYLVLPFLPPLTVRDGIGLAVDAVLDPFNYVVFPAAALTSAGFGKRVNDRALNLELFENVEEMTLDLYSAVRNAYLQRRQKAIAE